MRQCRAQVVWLTPEQGGRSSPPSGPRFVVPCRVEGVHAPGAQGANWSLVLNLVSRPPGSADWIADVQFLVDQAPHELLGDGARFELYEGKKCIARGTVLPALLPQPADEARATKEAHLTS